MSIGETLTAARRDAGLTIAQVSQATRVRETIVAGIERDDFSFCGGHFYARGHIRSIATFIGIDPEPLVETYDAEHGGSPRATLPDGMVDIDSAPIRVTERRRPNWSVLMAALLLVVVILGVFRLFAGSEEPARQPQNDTGPIVELPGSPSETPERSSSPSRSADSQSAKGRSDQSKPAAVKGATRPPESSLAAIRLKATAPTWVSASNADGDELFVGTLYAGDSVHFTDKELIRVVVGNAGGVRLTVNGKDLGVVGDSGDVEGLRVYPDRFEGLS